MSVGTPRRTSFSFAALTCGTSYTLGVEAFDAAGNVSAARDDQRRRRPPALTSTAAVRADRRSRQAASPATSIPVTWTRSTDNVGVAGYTLLLNGATVGTTHRGDLHLRRPHLRYELPAGRAGVRRGGQRLAARHGDGEYDGVPRHDAADAAGVLRRRHGHDDVRSSRRSRRRRTTSPSPATRSTATA